jgi:hypothetical protein
MLLPCEWCREEVGERVARTLLCFLGDVAQTAPEPSESEFPKGIILVPFLWLPLQAAVLKGRPGAGFPVLSSRYDRGALPLVLCQNFLSR